MSEASTLQTLASAALAASGSAPPLRAGQVVAATVQALLKDGLVRLALPQGTVDVAPPVPLAPGAAVRLEVVKAPPELVLRLVDPPAAAQGQPASVPPSAAALPRPIPVSYPPASPPPPALAAGRSVEGRIVALGSEGLIRVATPQGEVVVAARAPVPLGVPVRIDPPRAGAGPMLTVLSAGPSSASPASPPSAPIPLASSPAPAMASSPPAPPAMPRTPVMPAQPVISAQMAQPLPAPLPAAQGMPVPLQAPGTVPQVAQPFPSPLPQAPQSAPPAGQLPAAPPGTPPPVAAPSAPPGAAVPPPAVSSPTPPTSLSAVMGAGEADAPLGLQADSARFAARATGRPALAEPSLPLAQRAVLLPALQSGIGRQQGLAPLMANLAAVTDAPDPALPPAVTAAAQKVLGARLPLDRPFGADDIARAVAGSGVLYEARLAAGAPPTSLAGDLKGALLMLRNLLQSFVGTADSFTAAPQPGGDTPAPPLRGDPPSAQRPAMAAIAVDGTPEEIGRTLLTQTEGALARTRLLQIASLPDDGAPGRPAPPAALHVEIPVVFGQQAAVAQFAVERDGHGAGAEGEAATVWRMRFALDIEPMGPVHALVTLRGEAAAVTLWAERPQTADDLTAASADLRVALDRADFAVDDVVVRRGAPPRPAHPPGGFMDRRT